MNDIISFPDDSRIWIYASNKRIDESQIPEVQAAIKTFSKQWTSHREDVRATGGLLHAYFVLLVVDENVNKPGGCSIDASVQFIRELGSKLSCDFFDRHLFHYLKDERVYSIHSNMLTEAYEKGLITDSTLFFDNLVTSKQEFQKNWLKPLKESWHKKFISS